MSLTLKRMGGRLPRKHRRRSTPPPERGGLLPNRGIGGIGGFSIEDPPDSSTDSAAPAAPMPEAGAPRETPRGSGR